MRQIKASVLEFLLLNELHAQPEYSYSAVARSSRQFTHYWDLTRNLIHLRLDSE